ncbi:MAG: DUF4430 domain-containing protein [bacterium]|nr:DUF4430 domain-containing protein [bacterium]
MKKYKNKIIVGLIIVIALCISYFSGNVNFSNTSGGDEYAKITNEKIEDMKQATSDEKDALVANKEDKKDKEDKGKEDKKGKEAKEKAHEAGKDQGDQKGPKDKKEQKDKQGQQDKEDKNVISPQEEKKKTKEADTKEKTTSQAAKQSKDQYQTDPVPEGKPEPVEPQDVTITKKAYTCTLSISCNTILDNMEDLVPEKACLVPEDGILLASEEVTFYEGESVFDVLLRETKNHKMHMEFVNTPIYNSAYIEGIGNLYEFDCGQLSGWMYKVNDWFPNYGCSRYMLEPGDKVEWVYTCDLGRDVGGYTEAMEGE